MKLNMNEKKELIEAARGERILDLIIKNVKMLNVFTGEIYSADIGIYNGYIAHIETDSDKIKNKKKMKAEQIYKGRGKYLIPGLIDSHVHIESSMMTPRNFAKTVIPHGTTTVITDPHEIGNVMGIEGVEYMLKASEDLPMNQYILAPSCVPSAPEFEEGGAVFGTEEINKLLHKKRILGLAEVMDFPGVLAGSERMMKIIQETETFNGYIQGHAPGLRGRDLSAYLSAGPRSDHEIKLTEEAREKLRMGMTVNARESSISQDLKQLIPALEGMEFPPNFTLCTDDREAADLLEEGHMNYVVRRAIEEGLKPWQAVRAATLNIAKDMGLDNMGAIAPGYIADLVLVPSLEEIKPTAVFYRGKPVAENGEMISSIPDKTFKLEKKNTVNLKSFTRKDFIINSSSRKEGTIKARVIDYESENSIFTEFKNVDIPIKNGQLDLKDNDIKLAAVFNRYKDNDNKTLGLISNFGIEKGAIASTVSHDCHNLTLVASNSEDAAIAANALIESGGGLVCVHNGEILSQVELPVAGLISSLSADKLSSKIKTFKNNLRKIGMKGKYPLLKIATLTLAVIPEAKITDKGLLSVSSQKLVSLFPGEK